MNMRNRIQNPAVMIRIGSAFLIVALLSLRYLHPTAHILQVLTDGASGIAFGIAIGCLLLAARVNARRRAGETPCA